MKHFSGVAIAYIDMLLSFAIVCLGLAILIIPNPPVTAAGMDKPICSLAIDMEWDKNDNADVDLWAKAPGDKAVGYSSKDGKYLNLVRDDLGNLYSSDKANHERVCARGLPAGEYIVNSHLYAYRAVPLPISVSITVSVVDPGSAMLTEIYKRTIKIDRNGDEITVVRFELDTSGKLISSSIHDIPISLRTTLPSNNRSLPTVSGE